MLALFVIACSLLIDSLKCNQVYYGTMNFPRSNIFAKSKDQNTMYAAGEDLKIYRINYTRVINSSSFDYNYTTAHVKRMRAIGVSKSERYLATGSQDYSIQITDSFKKSQICYFTAQNQIRSLVFHPVYQQILFAASADDAIRKYNVSNCTLLAEKAVDSSVHSMIINDDGTFLAFGTYEGHVGKIDQNLIIFDLSLNAHRLTVLYMFFTYHDYYISIGDDNKVILWKAGFQVSNFSSLSAKKLKICAIFEKYDLIDKYRAFSCMQTGGGTCFTMLVTNSTFTRWSNHVCAPSSSNWVDFIRFSIDEQVWAYHYGTTIQYQRIFEDPSSLCNAGINHLMPDTITTKTCRFCGYLLPGCHFCVSGTCTGCGIVSYQVGNSCINCPTWCSDCANASSCYNCAVGYERNGAANTICKLAISQQGCFQIEWVGNSGNGFGGNNKCMIAGNGYYVTSSKDSQTCISYLSYCMQCTQSTFPLCLTCKRGAFINAYSKCSACNATMPGCQACFNSTTCLKCAVAFKYNGANLQCSSCAGSCQTCLTFYDQCSTCFRNQNRYLKDNKCICKDGYFDNSAAGNFTCLLCINYLQFCYLCTSSTTCTQCQKNYFLIQNGVKLECQVCGKYCETCTGTSDNCTSCNKLTFNRVLLGNDCICEVGFVSVGSSVPCLPCDKLNIGCTGCSTQTYCNSCDTGYYLKTSGSTRLCQPCPYYCPDCNITFAGDVFCKSCPPNTFRTLTNFSCPCDAGYFDDNRTLVCQKCSDVLDYCLTCKNRTKCTQCEPGLFTDSTRSYCATCNPICLTCGAFYDICATCDASKYRVLSNNKCVCESFTYQKDGLCIPCSDEIKNCISCENPYLCTGCARGFTLQDDLKGCMDCEGSINGCVACTSIKNCTSCRNPFTLIHYRCRCPINMYTSKKLWGKCKSYGIPGLKSYLGVQLEAHQHQNNSLIVFIRFRAKTLYVLGRKIQQSIRLSINGAICPINFTYINNNKVKIMTPLNITYENPNITVTFLNNVFYNEDLLTLSQVNETVVPTRLYISHSSQIDVYEALREVLRYTFYVLKWVFFGFSIIGQGHLLFPFVVFIQLMPLFLMLKMSLPPNLSMVLDAMLSFQVKSVIPMMSMKSNFYVIFPPMTYDYYDLYDFLLLGKIGDLLLVIFVNVMTKFDEGIVRMFPPGKIRRYLYESLVRRGYAVLSLCLLSFQPSFILLAGVYIKYDQWESTEEIFNYCCCLFVFGFFLAYNFNHASNLQGGKLMKNLENQQCFFGINSQERTAPRTTLFVLVTDFWFVASLHLVGPVIYFPTSIFFLFIRFILHLKRDFYIGRVQFAVRTLTNIFLIVIFSLMYVFYLAEKQIYISIEIAQILGLLSSCFILLYLLLYIVEKVLHTFKLQADFIEQKVVTNEKGVKVVVLDTEAAENAHQNQKPKSEEDNVNQNKMKELFTTTQTPDKTFSALGFKKRQQRQNNRIEAEMIKQDSNYPMADHHAVLQTQENENQAMAKNLSDKANAFFNNKIQNKTIERFSKIKTANTSKYAKNHLQLRYKAQGILTKPPAVFEED